MREIKLLPCICGNKRITRWYGVMPPSYQKIEYYKCDKCGLTANLSKTNHQARLNWNKAIEEERHG